MPDKRPFLPVRSRDEEFRLDWLHDDIQAEVADPDERRVLSRLAFNLLTDYYPDTVGDALSILENSPREALRSYYDRARQDVGLPTLLGAEIAARPQVASPERDASGRIPAICGHPGCNQFLPSEHGQFALVEVVKYACPAHAPLHPEWGEKWEPPRYELGPGGSIVDVAEREREIRRAMADDERLRLGREALEAEAQQEIEALREFVEHRRERDRQALRYQFPHLVDAEGAA